MRTFECAGYEIPQLVEYRPGIEALFEPGEEIAVYERPDSVAEAARSLLTDAPRQARLATRALARARAEHTYSHRVQQIFADLA